MASRKLAHTSCRKINESASKIVSVQFKPFEASLRNLISLPQYKFNVL